ncbi:MAG: hypothetical protein WBM50_13630 [Acidimicrobiales bacterium]
MFNMTKLIVAAVLALACIAALIVNPDANYSWAAPVLGILVGYVVGNAQVTSREGNTAPIINTTGS